MQAWKPVGLLLLINTSGGRAGLGKTETERRWEWVREGCYKKHTIISACN